jgi:DNA-binding transcriptional LysR family regulator
LIQRQLEEGTLIEVLAHLATDGMVINLAWQKSREKLPKVSALLEALAANLCQPVEGNPRKAVDV